MVNARDHAASEKSRDFPRISNCAVYLRLWCQHCDVACSADVLGSQSRNYAMRQTFMEQERSGRRCSQPRVSTSSSTEAELRRKESSWRIEVHLLAIARGHRDEKSLEGTKGQGSPFQMHKGTYYVRPHVWSSTCIWQVHEEQRLAVILNLLRGGDFFLRNAQWQLNGLRKDTT